MSFGPIASTGARKVIKFTLKVGLFGGAVYFVTSNDLWFNKSEYSSARALQDIKKGADKFLGTEMSILDWKLANKWNSGVSKSCDFLANFPEKMSSKLNDSLNYINKKLE